MDPLAGKYPRSVLREFEPGPRIVDACRNARRMRTVGRLPIALLATILVASCGNHEKGPASQLSYPGSGGFGLSLITLPGGIYSVGGLTLCSSSGSVEVLGIEAAAISGVVSISHWGSRPNPFLSGGQMLGAEAKPIDRQGFLAGGRPTVSNRCTRDPAEVEADPPLVEFAVELTASPGGEPAEIKGLAIEWKARGSEGAGTLLVPWTIRLCGAVACAAP